MANNDYAGVFVKEVFKAKPTGTASIGGAGAFFGVLRRGAKDTPLLVTSYEEFENLYGKSLSNSELHLAVYDFFQEGGSECYLFNPSFSDSSSGAPQKYLDTVAFGMIPINSGITKTVTSGNSFEATKAEVLFKSVNADYIDHSTKVYGNTMLSDLDLTSVRVKFNGVVVAIANSDGSFTNIKELELANGNLVKVGAGSIAMTADTDLMEDIMVSITPELVSTGGAIGTDISVSFEYTINNTDLHSATATSTAVAVTASDIVITTDLLYTDYAELEVSDLMLNSLTLDQNTGTNIYSYDNTVDSLSLVGAPLTKIGLTTMNTTLSNVGGFLTITIPTTVDQTAVLTGAITATLKIEAGNTTAFFNDKESFYEKSANTFFKLSSLYASNDYNNYFLRMSSSESYRDDYGNTVYVDADVMKTQYASDGVTEITPNTEEEISQMSFDSEDSEYFFTMFNDLDIGSSLLSVDDNSQTAVVPQSIATIGNGNMTDGYQYGNTVFDATGFNALTPDVSLLDANTLVKIVPGSVRMVLGVGSATGDSVVSVTTTYKDNGVGGFFNESTLDNLNNLAINYETGLVTGISSEANLQVSGVPSVLRFSYAITPLAEYVDFTVVDGVGGTEVQQSYLSSSVLTDSVLEDQGRGIYALTKIKGKMVTWGIPDLTTSYDIAVPCMELCDAQDVKTLIYVWNLDDELSPIEVGQRITYQYTYRTKNAFVSYPFKVVENINSDVVRNGKKQKVSISNVGAIVGKVSSRISSGNPHVSIAGTDGVMAWGLAPSRNVSIKETALLTQLVVPLIVDERVGGLTFMNDGSLADRAFDFETVSDTLVFNTVEFELETLLWEFIFKIVNDDLLGRVKANASRKLVSKTDLGWFSTYDYKEAFSIDMTDNTTATKKNREVYISTDFQLPVSLRKVHLTVSRKQTT